MPSLTLDIKPESPLNKFLCEKVKDRIEFSRERFKDRWEKMRKNEEKHIAYLPERSADALRRTEREQGGKPQYTTIVLPYTYSVLMASHTYWTTVFMSRSPTLQFAGRHGEGEQQVQALEALIDYQVQVGKMLVPLYIWLLDVGKYGVGVISTYWRDEVSYVSEIVEEETKIAGVIPTGRMTKKKIVRAVPGYKGNKLFNVRPMDFFADPRVPLYKFQEGEYCGRYVELGWHEVLRRKAQGYYMNIDKIPQDSTSASMREPSSSQTPLPDENDIFGREGTASRKVASVFKGYELCVELVPMDWHLGKGELPEKWVFTVTQDFKTMIGAQPLGALHDEFPYDVIVLEPEGYSLMNRGLGEIIDPIQNTMDWLINSHFYNVRKTLNNQFLFDPSRLVMKDLLNPAAGGLIRAKPLAYGTDLRQSLVQLPVADVTRGNLADLSVMNEFGQRITGVNDQILGMLVPQGGRRSATEVRTSSTFGTNRLKTSAEYFSAMGWAPFAQKLVQNTQQYYDDQRKFRIVGDLAQQAGTLFRQVDPATIKGFYDLVPVDGSLPVDRYAQVQLWANLMAQMRNFPQVMAGYDFGKIFSFVAQLAGLKNINQFKIQVVPDATAMAQAQAGNLIPMTEPVPNPNADLTRVSEPRQLEGMGTTG